MSKSRAHSAPQSRPLRTRVFVGAVALCCIAAAGVGTVERKELPAGLRDNPVVTALYSARERVIRKGEEWVDRKAPDAGTADAKQQGYEKEDRKKLEALISKGAQND